jgi:hypothetical protein
MPKIKNSDIMKEVILMLIMITGRRSSETIAAAFMEAILKSLEEKYDFLKYITVKNITYHEGIRRDTISIKSKISSVKPEVIGDAIETIIRVLCMDLEEDTGLFFIKELQDRLHEKYVLDLRKRGVDLELLKLEQKHLHEQLERKKAFIHHDEESEDSEIKVDMPNYSWKSVASFKYRNNICFLYDKNGKLLDKLNVNKLIEYYVRTLTDFGKLVLKENRVELNEKQQKLLQLLYERDVDEETAKFILKATSAEFNNMLQQLLRYEFLQYVSFDEIKLTEKGIELIEEKKKQAEEATAV